MSDNNKKQKTSNRSDSEDSVEDSVQAEVEAETKGNIKILFTVSKKMSIKGIDTTELWGLDKAIPEGIPDDTYNKAVGILYACYKETGHSGSVFLPILRNYTIAGTSTTCLTSETIDELLKADRSCIGNGPSGFVLTSEVQEHFQQALDAVAFFYTQLGDYFKVEWKAASLQELLQAIVKSFEKEAYVNGTTRVSRAY